MSLFFAVPAFAVDYQDAGDFSIWPLVSAYKFDSKRHFQDGGGPGVAIGYYLTPQWVTEASLMAYSTKLVNQNRKDINGEYYLLNGSYYFHTNEAAWQPYLTAGIGVNHANVPQQSYQTLPLVNTGVGLVYYFKDNLGIRAAINDFYSFSQGGYNDIGGSIGVNIILDPHEEMDPFNKISPNDAALIESPAPIPCKENHYLAR